MNDVYTAHPEQWLYDSKTGKPVRGPGDRTFNPPKGGMLIFDHARPSVRKFWKDVCYNATASGFVDGCFSDSSQPGTHGTSSHLNASANAAFEAGKIQTMSEVVTKFGGQAGKPYGDSTGELSVSTSSLNPLPHCTLPRQACSSAKSQIKQGSTLIKLSNSLQIKLQSLS
jgi:hypothetical protein